MATDRHVAVGTEIVGKGGEAKVSKGLTYFCQKVGFIVEKVSLWIVTSVMSTFGRCRTRSIRYECGTFFQGGNPDDTPKHRLRMPGEKIAWTAQLNIKSQSQICMYGWSIFCLPHWPKISDFFDLCLHWVSIVRALKHAKTNCGRHRNHWL